MTAPCDPEAIQEPRAEEQQILLRLGDILPRVPAQCLKPGPHDSASQVRFSLSELAEKIAHGRVSVPIQRLASVLPDVFRDCEAFPGAQEIQLPLQKLLEQIVLAKPKPKPLAPDGASQPAQPLPEPAENTAPAPDSGPRIFKAISTARQILGRFGRSSEPKPEVVTPEKPAEDKPLPADEKITPLSNGDLPQQPAADPPQLPAAGPPQEPAATPPQEPAATPPQEPAATPPQEPADAPRAIPDGFISLGVLPIFRLIPSELLKSGPVPSIDDRILLPLPAVDPQLADGHVEIPLEEFIKALPEGLREAITPVEKTQVWIPLDEIFQNLPPDHPFYMPPFCELDPERATDSYLATTVQNDVIQVITKPAPPTASNEKPEVLLLLPPPPPTEPARPSAGPPSSAADRAPWMRGFQVPPPRLFSGSPKPNDASAEAPRIDPTPPAAPTPEARRTADFLASQPGVFAAAAFVEGAVFASADFPRKPDLDALRDFMGAFVGEARESGQRLGWNRVLTIGCDQFHVTAVVRPTHFIVALHHDRLLPSLAHQALIAAADELGENLVAKS